MQALSGISVGAQGAAQVAMGVTQVGALATHGIPVLGAVTGVLKTAGGIAGVIGNHKTQKASEKILGSDDLAKGYQSDSTNAQNDYETLNMLRNAAYTRKVEAGFDIATGALDTAAGIANAAGGAGGAGGALVAASLAGKGAKFATGQGMRSHYANKETKDLMDNSFGGIKSDPIFSTLSDREKNHYIKKLAHVQKRKQLESQMQVAQATRLHSEIKSGNVSDRNAEVLAAMGYKDPTKYKNISVQMLATKLGYTGKKWQDALTDKTNGDELEINQNLAQAQAAADAKKAKNAPPMPEAPKMDPIMAMWYMQKLLQKEKRTKARRADQIAQGNDEYGFDLSL